MLKKNCFQLFQITGHFKCAGEFPAIINNKDDKKRGSRHSVYIIRTFREISLLSSLWCDCVFRNEDVRKKLKSLLIVYYSMFEERNNLMGSCFSVL